MLQEAKPVQQNLDALKATTSEKAAIVDRLMEESAAALESLGFVVPEDGGRTRSAEIDKVIGYAVRRRPARLEVRPRGASGLASSG